MGALHDGCFLLSVCVRCVFGVTLTLNMCLLLPDMSCRSRLATLNEKLTALERRIEYIEARVSEGQGCPRACTIPLAAEANVKAETGLEKPSTCLHLNQDP